MRSVVLFFFMVLFSNIGIAQNFDIQLLRNININRNTSLDCPFLILTHTVTPFAIATPVITFGVGIFKKDSTLKKKGIILFETTVAAVLLSSSLKLLVHRPRPFITFPDIQQQTPVSDYSFPSGHTTEAFATATSLALAFPKWYVIAPAYVWAGLVGYSRMHLGVHYPTDVFTGAVIGAGTALLTHRINAYLSSK